MYVISLHCDDSGVQEISCILRYLKPCLSLSYQHRHRTITKRINICIATKLSGSIGMKVLSIIVLVFVVTVQARQQTRGLRQTQGCENCPPGTECIYEMCYTVVASPPGLESGCNQAVCTVESGGRCIDDKCVVPVSVASTDTNGTQIIEEKVPASSAVTRSIVSATMALVLLLLCLV